MLLVAIGLVEWLVTEAIGEHHLAVTVTAVISIGIGIGFNKVHVRAERMLDRLLFRERYHAEEYLERVGRALAEATVADAVGDALAREACDALRLAAAAVFVYDEQSDVYERTHVFGWREEIVARFDINASLVRSLRADCRILRGGDISRPETPAPLDPPPVAAVPVVLGRDVLAFALYGPHVNSTDIDPDELELLEHLARDASVAYMQVNARARERELAELRNSHRSLRAVAAERSSRRSG